MLVRVSVVGGPSERKLPARALQEVSYAQMFFCKLVMKYVVSICFFHGQENSDLFFINLKINGKKMVRVVLFSVRMYYDQAKVQICEFVVIVVIIDSLMPQN